MDPSAAHALNGGDDEDDALRRAIALSLGVDNSSAEVEIIESRPGSNSRRTDAIDLTLDSPEPEPEPVPLPNQRPSGLHHRRLYPAALTLFSEWIERRWKRNVWRGY
ncbi:hypothetical protein MCOR02_001763 [Pyricularia oryzae]|nr:hypothetical protein MCOR02_001763 [Pyricularia oryzae]